MIKIKIAHLLEKHDLNATDLMRQANIAYATALRLSKDQGNGITFEVLNSLCKLFSVPVEQIIEYVPDDEN
jgi:DNA-binding Xre family transcriptional regulator